MRDKDVRRVASRFLEGNPGERLIHLWRFSFHVEAIDLYNPPKLLSSTGLVGATPCEPIRSNLKPAQMG